MRDLLELKLGCDDACMRKCSRVNGSGCGKTRVIAESWGEDFGID